MVRRTLIVCTLLSWKKQIRRRQIIANYLECLSQMPFTGLLHKAISQSGTAMNPWALHDLQKWSFLLAEKLGKRTSDPKLAGEFLKTIDARKIVEATETLCTEIVNILIILIKLSYCNYRKTNMIDIM